ECLLSGRQRAETALVIGRDVFRHIMVAMSCCAHPAEGVEGELKVLDELANVRLAVDCRHGSLHHHTVARGRNLSREVGALSDVKEAFDLAAVIAEGPSEDRTAHDRWRVA